MRRFVARLTNLLRPRRAEAEMEREIHAHVALMQEEFEQQGLSPAEADMAARRAYGGVERSKEVHREARSFLWIEQMLQDVRYSFRNLIRTPAFTLTAIGALALGIGATTAVFSVVNAVVLRPLPIPDADRLVMLMFGGTDDKGEAERSPSMSPAMYAHWREQTDVLEDVGAFHSDGIVNYTGGDVVEQWRSMTTTVATLRCTGEEFLLGRPFSPQEEAPHGPLVAILGEGIWMRRFAGSHEVLGKVVSLNEKPYTIIGVARENPGERQFGQPDDVYLPLQIDPESRDEGQYFMAMAHLKRGVTLEQANARVEATSAEFRAKFKQSLAPNASFTLVSFNEFLVGDVRALLLILQGSVVLVLLIACANVANLSLARAAVRQREIGIRAAIGAGRGRILRQLLSESLLLSLAGGAAGLALGYSGIRILLAANTAGLARVGDKGESVVLDWRVVAFAMAVSLLTALLSGLLPALRASRVDLNAVLKDGGGRTGAGSHQGLRQNKARAILVVSEVGLAVVLLVGSALLIRSFSALYHVDRGFDASNVITMKILMTGSKTATSAGMAQTIQAGLDRVRAIPGVAAAGATCCLPLQGQNSLPFDIVGKPASNSVDDAGWVSASAGFFETFRIPLRRGRTFNDRDGAKSPPVVIINETLAKKVWKDGDPLSDRIVIGRSIMKELKDEPARQIIGVVADVRDTGLGNAPRPILYVPQGQIPDAFTAAFFHDDQISWAIRTRGKPHDLTAEIQKALRQGTGFPATDVLMMDEVVSLSTGRQQFALLLMSVFGFAALLLAGIGIYGLMTYTVEQRTQEIGIRLALGAATSQVRNMVLRQGMILVLVGLGLGLAAAWALSRSMESLLFGVQAHDEMAFIGVPIALAATAFVAVWLPARRALRVDPVEALRHE